jgi:hypothetical protein
LLSFKEACKDVSNLYKDSKREDLDAAIFNLREIESKQSFAFVQHFLLNN